MTSPRPSPNAEPHETLSAKLGVDVYGLAGMKHAGYAHPEHRSVTLREGLCRLLERPRVSRQTANALFVLAHELGHVLVPTNDELRADDYAVTHFQPLALRLGLSHRQADRLWRLCPYR